jgi:hypothetical protein
LFHIHETIDGHRVHLNPALTVEIAGGKAVREFTGESPFYRSRFIDEHKPHRAVGLHGRERNREAEHGRHEQWQAERCNQEPLRADAVQEFLAGDKQEAADTGIHVSISP